MRPLIALGAALVVALSIAAPANAWVTFTTVNGAEMQAEFVDPDVVGYPYRDEWPALKHVERLINETPSWSGATIYGGIHSLNVRYIRDALINAHNRGIVVRLVHSRADSGSYETQTLHQALGAAHKYCGPTGTNSACVSNVGGALMHAKFFLFSRTRRANGDRALVDKVTWFGTANMTYETGADAFNDSITVYGDHSLYDKFKSMIFDKYWAMSPRTSDFLNPSIPQGIFASSHSKIEVRASPNPDHDLAVDELNRMLDPGNCEVRVMANKFARYEVADKLVSLRRAGCHVWVLSNIMTCSVRDHLVYWGVAVRHRTKMHAKTMILKGHIGGIPSGYAVVTGSHNLNYNSLRKHDEIQATVPGNAALHQGYVDHFFRSWVGARPEDEGWGADCTPDAES